MPPTTRRFSSARLNLAVWSASAGRLVDDLVWGVRAGAVAGPFVWLLGAGLGWWTV
jgi:hypothetical protein